MYDNNYLLNSYFTCLAETEQLIMDLNKCRNYCDKLKSYKRKKVEQLSDLQQKKFSYLFFRERYNVKLSIVQETISFFESEIEKNIQYMIDLRIKLRQKRTYLSSIEKRVK